MKRHLLTALTVVISSILLASSLAVWPFLEGMLLAKMDQAIREAATDRNPDSKPMHADEEIPLPSGNISGPLRPIAWAGFGVLDLWQKAMAWGGYGSMLTLSGLYLGKALRQRMGSLRIKLMSAWNYLKNILSFEKAGGLIIALFTIPIAGKTKPQRGRTMKRLWIVIFCSVSFLLQSTPEVSAQFSEAGVEKLRVAVDAPDLTLRELGGGRISLKELRGKIIVLNFFATWCPHCQREAPSMVKLHEEFKSTDLVLLKVATKEKENDLIKHKNEFNTTFPILMDDDASCANTYGVWNRPATFLINREGKIVGRLVKEVEWTSKGMRKLIQSLLKGEKP